MKTTVKLSGVKQTTSKLDSLIRSVSDTQPKVLHEIGQRAVGILKLNTPVDKGRLRQSMGYSLRGRVVSQASTANDKIAPNAEQDSVVVGTNVVYAEHVEYLSKNGSQGFFTRSYKQINVMAKAVITKGFQGGVK